METPCRSVTITIQPCQANAHKDSGPGLLNRPADSGNPQVSWPAPKLARRRVTGSPWARRAAQVGRVAPRQARRIGLPPSTITTVRLGRANRADPGPWHPRQAGVDPCGIRAVLGDHKAPVSFQPVVREALSDRGRAPARHRRPPPTRTHDGLIRHFRLPSRQIIRSSESICCESAPKKIGVIGSWRDTRRWLPAYKDLSAQQRLAGRRNVRPGHRCKQVLDLS